VNNTKFNTGQLVQVNQYAEFISVDAMRFHGKLGIIREVFHYRPMPTGMGRGNPPFLYYLDFLDGEKSCSGLWTSELIAPRKDMVDKLTRLDKLIYGIT
jgi:hypothetical protein